MRKIGSKMGPGHRWNALMVLGAVLVFPRLQQAAEFELEEVWCDKTSLLASQITSGAGLQYAPDRKIDILHVTIDVTPDFEKRTVAGQTTTKFVPIALPLEELRLDAIDLAISSVTASVAIAEWQVTDTEVIVTFERPIDPGSETTVTIAHAAEPQQGLYFRTPEMGYRPGDTHLFTQGEATEARHWYPCFDTPNEKFTSEVICHVDRGMRAFSNGRLIEETTDAATGKVAFRWLQDKPHTTYLISLVAGYMEMIEDNHGDIPLAYLTPPSQIAQAPNSFRDTKDAMIFFEQEIGVPYPWDKYYEVVVDDFVAGGMENTSMTTLTSRTLFTDATENIRSSESLMAHELVHQWFGDLVTCKDWSHIWLNEGFATYYALLYDEHKNGRDSMLYKLWRNRGIITARSQTLRPIVLRRYDDPMEQFESRRAYTKGGWALHMLRSQLGEDLYRTAIKTYLERHAYGNVVTEDLNQALEEVSGRSFDRFFDQWIYHGGAPELEIRYEWLAIEGLAKVTVRQTQELSDSILLFTLPLTFRFKSGSTVVDREVELTEEEQDFYFPLDEAPTIVRFDPDLTVLAKVDFKKPNAMVYAQLADDSDAIGRVIAAASLRTKSDRRTVARLKKALNSDAFYGVRMECARALGVIHTDEALEALSESLEQDDARVRQRVADSIGKFYDEESLEIIQALLETEKNPAIVATALGSLGKYHRSDVRQTILESLRSQSYRNEIAAGAVGAIRGLDDPSYIEPLTETLARREDEFTTRRFGRALGALGYIARNEEDRSGVRDFLAGYVNHDKRGVQLAALRALGALRDPSAAGIVDAFATGDETDSIAQAARRTLTTLREAKEVPVELSDLRSEVTELKKQNEAIREEFEDLKNKVESRTGGRREAARRKWFFGLF